MRAFEFAIVMFGSMSAGKRALGQWATGSAFRSRIYLRQRCRGTAASLALEATDRASVDDGTVASLAAKPVLSRGPSRATVGRFLVTASAACQRRTSARLLDAEDRA